MVGNQYSRRTVLKGGLGMTAAAWLAACGGGSSSSTSGLHWLTWSDHYIPEQLKSVRGNLGFGAEPTLQAGNAEGFLKLKRANSNWDLQSADALWASKMNKAGVTESFDIADVAASSELYPLARDLSFWADGTSTIAYPFGWSTVQVYFDGKRISTPPASWEFLLDKKFRGTVVTACEPTDMMALAGLAVNAKSPYGMTPDELNEAKRFLGEAKPAFLKVVTQSDEVVRTMADGAAKIAISNVGIEYLVKDAGGPELTSVTPTEGTFGFIDGEQLVAGSKNKERALEFLGSMERAEWIAQNFMLNGRPLFNEKAYKLLVNQGEKERADRLFYNEPERALEMTLKGPAGDEQAYTDAYNEVFGA